MAERDARTIGANNRRKRPQARGCPKKCGNNEEAGAEAGPGPKVLRGARSPTAGKLMEGARSDSKNVSKQGGREVKCGERSAWRGELPGKKRDRKPLRTTAAEMRARVLQAPPSPWYPHEERPPMKHAQRLLQPVFCVLRSACFQRRRLFAAEEGGNPANIPPRCFSSGSLCNLGRARLLCLWPNCCRPGCFAGTRNNIISAITKATAAKLMQNQAAGALRK